VATNRLAGALALDSTSIPAQECFADVEKFWRVVKHHWDLTLIGRSLSTFSAPRRIPSSLPPGHFIGSDKRSNRESLST